MPDTKDAEAFVGTLNRSAERVQALWLSFLTFGLYLAIATSTTTHRMLFLESPIKLPVLNIDLPLLGFYVLAPVIFVIFHFYVLLNLVLLARTAKTFEDTLRRVLPVDGDAREKIRMRIENALFVQLLVGGRPEREGINAKLLSWMALITLALAPVALILMFQIWFLPYHSEQITWLHRMLLFVDLVLVWTLWPGYRRGWGVRLWPERSRWLVGYVTLSTVALAYAVVVATFPDERMYLATNWWHGDPYKSSHGLDESQFHRNMFFLIAPISTLDLPGEDLVDDAALARVLEKSESTADAPRWVAARSLARRDLTGANLSDTDIRHVDFSGTILNRARLDRALAKDARLDGTRLQRAWLGEAQLQGASLRSAQLQGAWLDKAQLQGAALDRASLQRAWLGEARLQGASLKDAQLQSASLHKAHLQGVSLRSAQLQGAWLDRVQLQGASLDLAQLQGAWLDKAQLQGASLKDVELQGASLKGAQLQSASLVNVLAWRADARTVTWKDTRVADPETGKKHLCPYGGDDLHRCDWTTDKFDAFKSLTASQDPESYAVKRIEHWLDPRKVLEAENDMAEAWVARAIVSPTDETYEKSLAEQWRETGCATEGAPYVARAFLERLDVSNHSPFATHSPEVPKLATAFLDTERCPGARGLKEAEIAKLKAIRDRMPAPTPEP